MLTEIIMKKLFEEARIKTNLCMDEFIKKFKQMVVAINNLTDVVVGLDARITKLERRDNAN